TSISNRIQDLNRLREILMVFTRHGFGFLIDQLHLESYLPAKGRMVRRRTPKASVPARLRMVLDELGPTFIKLGQVLSMRPDVLPQEYIQELSKLQDQAAPINEAEAEAALCHELGGGPVSKYFASFEKKPFAAASVAQVHQAKTLDQKNVVVKLQRPDLKRRVESDLEILRFLARTWENFGEQELPRSPVEFIDEFEQLIFAELDFLNEARHLERFAKNFKNRPAYRFSRVYWELSTPRCLILEYIPGRKISELPANTSQAKKNKVVHALFEAYICMTLEDRFFHADPHAGNFILTQDGRLAFLDAGQVGRLDSETVAAFTDMLLALVGADTDSLVDAYLRLGTAEEGVDRRLLKRDTAIFLEQYYDLPVERISFGKAMQALMGLSIKHHISLPPDFVILAKTFLGVEGMARQLNPKLNLIKAAQPTAEAILRRRYMPEQIARQAYSQFQDIWRFARALPSQLQDLLRKLQHGKLKIEFEHKGLESLRHSLDRSGNRLSFSLIVAALIIGSSWLLASQIGPQWGGFSILGLVGFLLAGALGFVLIIAIMRSGRM
ncbi:AarF/ABC1/UbiB kinase family protein, partial [candidate division FCPU426 bacterium]|nr:AarF/ABC1/UbiB kinase family protein [candidate division FCPU426 bacterium]